MYRRHRHPFALILAAFALLIVVGIAAELLAHVWLVIAGIALVAMVRHLSVNPRAGARTLDRPATAPKVVASEVIRDDTESRAESDRDRLVNDRRSGARPLF
jgi:hypothetical protein